MEFCGQIVQHKAFGRGQITKFENNYITVLFDEIKVEKKFVYPFAFGEFLEMENEYFVNKIRKDKNAIARKKGEKKKKIDEEKAKLIDAIESKNSTAKLKGTSAKTYDKNNIAFKCNYCDGGKSKEVVGYTGVCSDEIIKYNIKVNGLALLTTRLPHDKEKERFIFAVFLVDENHEDENKSEGYIEANHKFRFQLSLDESRELKFWDYYSNPNKPESIVFGSGLHRYFTNIQASQILKKICQIKKGTSEEELSKEFLEYYCRVKELDIDKIPIPDGALQRI